MAASANKLILAGLLWAGCATAPTALPSNEGDAEEVRDFKFRFREFYEQARARLGQEFHGDQVAEAAQLGPGRWRCVVRIDLDITGDNHGCRLLRSSGFNGIDEEAVAACRRVKEHLFPPESSIEADALVHAPVQLVVERK